MSDKKREAVLREPMGELFSMGALPNIALQTQGPGMPRGLIDYSTPFIGGDLSVEGSYRPQQGERPDWSAMLRYRKQF